MVDYIVSITETEDKALSCVSISQQDWIDNAVRERCRVAIEEIVNITVRKCLDTNTIVPASVDDIVNLAINNGWVKPAKQKDEVSIEQEND